MNAEDVLRKADAGEALTVEEVMVYERTVKPVKHVYGKYGTLAKKYLEEHAPARYWAIEDLPAYLHGIDDAARRMWDTMYEMLTHSEQYKRNGNYMHDVRVLQEIRQLIDEEILNELVYVQ